MSFETTFNHLSLKIQQGCPNDGDADFLCLPDIPFSLDLLPSSAYLVGGAVRDALLTRKGEYLDLDFVLPQKAVETARKIALQHQGGFVVLDEQRQIARVVFPEGTVDFALQEGDSLEQDLQRRDFTINAIAYNVHQQKLLDPLCGLQDLQKRVIRMISTTNLEDDPLRLLRAYRQGAQLDFIIEPETRKAIRDRSNLIAQVAAERVQTELTYLLTNAEGSEWLIAAVEDGLFQPWLTEVTPAKLQQLKQIESIANSLTQKYPNSVFKHPECLSLAKLASLVTQSPATAELELLKLKYSRAQLRAVVSVVKHLRPLQTGTAPLTPREQYFFFLDIKDFFPILALRAIATSVKPELINPLIERYLNPQDKIAHPQSLVTGTDLINTLHLKPSPLIGKLLTEINIAYGEGKITTVEDALQFARYLLTL